MEESDLVLGGFYATLKPDLTWSAPGTLKLTLVDISLGVVGGLVLLVDDGILGGSSTAAQACVVVLGDVLVGLLGSFGTCAVDGLGHVVCGVLWREC